MHIDKDRDLALLSTRPSNTHSLYDQMKYIQDLTGYIKLSFATTQVKLLDKTYLFGCPQKYASSATAGTITQIFRDSSSFQNDRYIVY